MKIWAPILFVMAMFMGCTTEVNAPAFGSADGDSPYDNAHGGVSPKPGQIVDVDAVVDGDLALVEHLAFNIMTPSIVDMVGAVRTLSSDIVRSCSGGSQTRIDQLKASWFTAMDEFHYNEVFLYGPLLISNENKIGDENPIKKLFYSLSNPENQPTSIDREIEKASVQKEGYSPRPKDFILGLDALEYVLFRAMADETFLSEESVSCRYLQYVSEKLLKDMEDLQSNWNHKVVEPLQTPDGKTRLKVYINHFTKGLVAFSDKTLKDRKIAIPLGLEISDDIPFPCEIGVNCHSKYLEHQYSDYAQRAILQSLKAIEDSFEGESTDQYIGFGYNQYLEKMGVELIAINKSLAENFFSEIWSQLPGGALYAESFASFDGEKNSQNIVYQSYKKIREFTSWLKTDFVIDLNAELPTSVQGDND